MSVSQIDILRNQRRTVKGRITRIQTFLDNEVDPGVEALKVRLKGLEAAWKEYNSIHEKILNLNVQQDIDSQEADMVEVENKYYDLQSKLSTQINSLTQSQTCNQSIISTAAKSDVRLPKIELPTFNGNYLEWTNFRDLYINMIHSNEKLSGSQKFHYLKSAVEGEAANLIQSLEISDTTYEEAWGLLKDRYENKRQLVHSHIRALCGQTSIQGESASSLRRLLDTTLKHTRALKTLDCKTEEWSPLLVFMVTERLDAESRKQWELSITENNYPTFDKLKAFIEQRCRALEASGTNKNTRVLIPKNEKRRTDVKLGTTSFHIRSPGQTVDCPSCHSDHPVYRCPKFRDLAVDSRKSFAREHHLCFNCLRRGSHVRSNCPSESRCQRCRARHHTLLHEESQPPEGNTMDQASHSSSGSPAVQSVSSHVSHCSPAGQVVLPTARVKVRSVLGDYVQCRVLLDSAAQASFIGKDIAKQLGLRLVPERLPVHGISGCDGGESRARTTVHLQSMCSTFSCSVNAHVLPTLTGLLPNSPVQAAGCWDHLKNLQLADPFFFQPASIDIILGADVFAQLLLPGCMVGGPGEPSAYNTHLGWVVIGGEAKSPSHLNANLTVTDLGDELRRFWELEEIQQVPSMSPDDKLCEAIYDNTVRRDPATGRFQVELPKRKDVQIGYSKNTAIQRWEKMEAKLERNPELKKDYHGFITEYINLGHMEIVPEIEQGEQLSRTNYLPHHSVLKTDSTTTKLRVVFDASVRTSSGNSLNDALLTGPRLQDDLWQLLLRFRCYKYALTADIEKMFRQILVSSQDADLQRIVWRPSPACDLQEFRLTTVTYGTAAAPYLAVKTLQHLAKIDGDKFPLAKEVVLRDFYVDDVITGVNELKRGERLQSELQALLDGGGFHLRKWTSNHPSLLERVPDQDKQINLQACEFSSNSEATKTLGIHWLPSQDLFFYRPKIEDHHASNKRTILSDVSRIFDPLGWLSPLTIMGKILIQKLWLAGLDWDDELPPDLLGKWTQFRQQLPLVEQIQIPRCVAGEEKESYQLHGFSDASEEAYAASVYLRTERDGVIDVNLLIAKTRVSPVRQTSLPRLELCGAALLAKLMHVVQRTLLIPIEAIYAWSDSQVTLAWIRSHSRAWKTFIANRVSMIQEVLPPELWHHVPGSDNPADVASRGLFPAELKDCDLWWNGPKWLVEDPSCWPQEMSRPSDQDSDALQELKRKGSSPVTVLTVFTPEIIPRFSSLTRLKRVIAYCFRFVNNAKGPNQQRVSGPLSVDELDRALTACVKMTQHESFGEEMRLIQEGSEVRSSLLSLSPFIDDQGMLRVGGRLKHASCPFNQRFPILLPKSHKLTQLIVKDTHLRLLHAGPQTTLNMIRQNFWIVDGRSVVRGILHGCQRCRHDRLKSLNQRMGDLPSGRVQPTKPFHCCGVDYAGPLIVKETRLRNARKFKVYICLFICFSTKAVHIEVVTDLTSECFIAALKRFIARRGLIKQIHSDNGTSFVGASRELQQAFQTFMSQGVIEEIVNFLSKQGISWNFIPPRAPHFGGLWEAGVKTLKTHLRRIAGEANLTLEELHTLVTQIEACMNSRPLTPLSSSPDDYNVLTPGHFLIGEPLLALPEPSLVDTAANRLSRWQLVCQMTQHLWKRWHLDYISHLQQRTKWQASQDNLRKGELVLLKDPSAPPLSWPRGRIVATFPGDDGRVRVVDVKTSSGIYRRPIQKLCLLPLES